jgi:hypothetical protein
MAELNSMPPLLHRHPDEDARRLGVIPVLSPRKKRLELGQRLAHGGSDLLSPVRLPRVLGGFCSHVASDEVVLAQSGDRRKQLARALVPHPGHEFGEYIRNSFAFPKQRQATLLGSARPAAQAGRQVPSDP